MEVLIIGAGGHAKSVINVLWQVGYNTVAVVDDHPGKWGEKLLGVEIVAPDSRYVTKNKYPAIIAVGDNRLRQRIAKRFDHLHWITAVSPMATVYPSAQIGDGCLVLPYVLIGADTVIGNHVIVSAQCVVGHDTIINNFAHLAPGALLSGGVSIGEGAFLALGSKVIPGISVGNWATLGAGGVAMRNIADNGKVMGVPARSIPT